MNIQNFSESHLIHFINHAAGKRDGKRILYNLRRVNVAQRL